MSQNIDYKFVLQSQGFEFKKGLGQNFVFDTNLLNAIATDADIQSSDTVVEIGVGAGSLTNIIADRASRVVGFEIDKRLQAVHKLTIQRDSVEVKYKDFLQLNDNDIVSFGVYKVVANLPYYITTPIIFKLLESNNPPKSITIMVQKEVANRIVAKPNTPDYGVLTASVALRCQATITRKVSRAAFVPQPNVDSAIVRLDKLHCSNLNATNITKLIQAAFGNRRKMLVNNLVSNYSISKQKAQQALIQLGLPITIRGEALSVQQFVDLYNIISNI